MTYFPGATASIPIRAQAAHQKREATAAMRPDNTCRVSRTE